MEDILSFTLESRGSIGHNSSSLCCSDLTTEIRLAGFAELTLLTFWRADKNSAIATRTQRCRLTKVQLHSLQASQM